MAHRLLLLLALQLSGLLAGCTLPGLALQCSASVECPEGSRCVEQRCRSTDALTINEGEGEGEGEGEPGEGEGEPGEGEGEPGEGEGEPGEGEGEPVEQEAAVPAAAPVFAAPHSGDVFALWPMQLRAGVVADATGTSPLADLAASGDVSAALDGVVFAGGALRGQVDKLADTAAIAVGIWFEANDTAHGTLFVLHDGDHEAVRVFLQDGELKAAVQGETFGIEQDVPSGPVLVQFQLSAENARLRWRTPGCGDGPSANHGASGLPTDAVQAVMGNSLAQDDALSGTVFRAVVRRPGPGALGPFCSAGPFAAAGDGDGDGIDDDTDTCMLHGDAAYQRPQIAADALVFGDSPLCARPLGDTAMLWPMIEDTADVAGVWSAALATSAPVADGLVLDGPTRSAAATLPTATAQGAFGQPSGYSVEVWLSFAASPDTPVGIFSLINANNALVRLYRSGGEFVAESKRNTLMRVLAPVPDTELVHVVLTDWNVQGDDLQLYVNGQRASVVQPGGTAESTGLLTPVHEPRLVLGADGLLSAMTGVVHAAAVYQRALTPQQVEAAYGHGPSRLADADGDGDTIDDAADCDTNLANANQTASCP